MHQCQLVEFTASELKKYAIPKQKESSCKHFSSDVDEILELFFPGST